MLKLKIRLNELHQFALWAVFDSMLTMNDEMRKARWASWDQQNWSDKSPSGLRVLTLNVSEHVWDRLYQEAENKKIHAAISGDVNASRVFRSLAARLKLAKDEAEAKDA